ncbi:DNA polymerase I-like protein with 3'-5' exonuclease and polymerase domains [Curtobacterium pusillum]|uniref:DNA polymerase I-like protein with 3'-5' exonuclease and polymerase domains n=1 Tax=Curtobacterium pusillum TaxID=69373 RepID=A0AAW3T2J7_9MICO|nr:DNA polymerase I-like protein with 3'-5' exonuclease and polymerase domains [Curtobacterium pusillum]
MTAESTPSYRAAAMRSVRQDHAWRPVQARGIRLDLDRLLRERTVVEEEARRLQVENGVNLMAASDAGVAAAHAWLVANGVTVRDATGHPSLEQDAVARAQVEDTTRARVSYGALLAARELGRTRGKLLELDRLRQGERVYPQMIVRHTRTGRALVRRPALQNLGRSLRGMLMADPGYVLVSLDYHQVEPSVAAAMSGDAQLAADVASGDVYAAAAAGWASGGAPMDRAQAKTAFLACLYGRGAASSATDLGVTQQEAAFLIEAVWGRYSRLREYRDELQARFAASVPMTTLGGRPIPALGRSELYKALNWMIQGSAADIFEGGVMRVADAIGPEALFLGVHDELILHVPSARAEYARQVLAEQMPCTLGSVIITGDAEVLGTHWRK